MYQGKKITYISPATARRLPKPRRKSVFLPQVKRFFHTYKTILLILVITILIGIIVHFSYVFTIGKPSNIVSEVVFTDEDLQSYNDPTIYKSIRQKFLWENIILLKMYRLGSVVENVKASYPFIKDIVVSKAWPGKISLSINFFTADLLFQNKEISIAYTNKTLFPVQDSDTILSGAVTVHLPDYFWWDTIKSNIKDYLSLMIPEKLKEDFTIIQNNVPIENNIYLPGAQKSIIISGNKKLTFDHKRSIETQIQYLQKLQSWIDKNMYYEIDLTTFPKIIIKKQTTPFL